MLGEFVKLFCFFTSLLRLAWRRSSSLRGANARYQGGAFQTAHALDSWISLLGLMRLARSLVRKRLQAGLGRIGSLLNLHVLQQSPAKQANQTNQNGV